LPAKIEDLLSDRPPKKCESFESIHPDSINHETEAIDQAAHYAVEQITLSNSFKEWLKMFFFNAKACPNVVPLHGQLTTKLNQNAEPGLIDKLLEL
jgi:hypothetical protein